LSTGNVSASDLVDDLPDELVEELKQKFEDEEL
jgi:hypothetical protein